ncbi:hypothetical protein CL176_04405 [Suicoccus acidiformans]|uniref:Glycosyl transferase family 1 domain-containing protein n=2 Tax=Suicoccus acidiformans TaxID=2036206 RepID=A0A347WJP1_9LACT|nr:hypothetical protein CL176_04405 [Suicoccus acidiformans]
MRDLNQIIHDNNYDIIHIHGNSRTLTTELYVCKRNKIEKRVVHAHSSSTKHPLLHKGLKKPFESLTQYNLSVSKEAGKFLFDQQCYQILPNGINVKNYKYNENKRKSLRKKYQIKDNEIVIGHVGELNKNKNQQYLINLIEILSKEDYRLILIGEGEDRDFLEMEISKKGLDKKVKLLGKLDNVYDWLNVFDLFVFPSLTEGLTLAVLEAQANGLKCYVSDTISEEVNVTQTLEIFNLSDSIDVLANKIRTNKRAKVRSHVKKCIKKFLNQTLT